MLPLADGAGRVVLGAAVGGSLAVAGAGRVVLGAAAGGSLLATEVGRVTGVAAGSSGSMATGRMNLRFLLFTEPSSNLTR